MNLRAKLLLVFVALALVPLVALSAFNYWSGLRSVEGLVREASEDRAARAARRTETLLDAQEVSLIALANSTPLRDYVRELRQAARAGGAQPAVAQQAEGRRSTDAAAVAREHLGLFYVNNRASFETVTMLDAAGRPLFRMSAREGGEADFQTKDIVASGLRYNDGVWALTGAKALRSPLAQGGMHGPTLGTTVPVFEGAGDGTPGGALVAEISLKEILEDAAQGTALAVAVSTRAGEGAAGDASQPSPRVIVALDNAAGLIVYHTNEALRHQPAPAAMPYFEAVARRMRAGESDGAGFYDAPDGDRWLAAFRQVRGVNLSVAVAEDYTAASAGVRRAGAAGIALASLAGLAAVALLLLIVRSTTSRIERVARAATDIARGDLDQRIEDRGDDEMSALAESFNLMSDRLREQMRHEAESKQFESFMRLSAMLTHDLKNAITGLSMLVSNMEKRFDRDEFRADAVASLRDATEKLSRIVSRLSEPMRSLSGEYRLDARPTDLVHIIRRVLAAQAEPSMPLYEIEARLPATLVATVEPGRIENVIENLVINALEAMGAAGGRLTVEAGAEDGRHVFVSVADTGIGMSEEFLQTRLFRPFMTTKTRGVGLGLFTCREIIETHGGRVEVESKLGAGTRFRIVLPSSLFTSGERRRQTTKGTFAVHPAAQPSGPDAPK
ncbi:MAG: HAMP domain-containing protein [Acidobacteria bacterium]|nr:HAMP domain-containing protein [Acidobacteriota bacterium]